MSLPPLLNTLLKARFLAKRTKHHAFSPRQHASRGQHHPICPGSLADTTSAFWPRQARCPHTRRFFSNPSIMNDSTRRNHTTTCLEGLFYHAYNRHAPSRFFSLPFSHLVPSAATFLHVYRMIKSFALTHPRVSERKTRLERPFCRNQPC